MKFTFASMALIGALFLAFQSSISHAAVVTKAEVIANISHQVILKTYVDFARSTAALKAAVATLVAKPTQTNLEVAQKRWIEARRAYEISEGFLFGPMDSLGIDPMIDTWPLNLKDMKLILEGSALIDAEKLRGLPSGLMGFHAIEYILFGEGVVTNTKDIQDLTERQKLYLEAATQLLDEQVNLLLSAWTSHADPENEQSAPYIQVLSQPGPQNPAYTSELAVVLEFANGIAGIVAEAGKAKLPDATGETPNQANPRLEESPFSWNSINDFTSNVDSVLNVYTGSFQGVKTGPGLEELVATIDPALGLRAKFQMTESRRLIQEIAGPNKMSFGQAIRDPKGRQRIFAAVKQLGELQQTLELEVLPLLGKN
jgi:putative iron-regulated protein